MNYIFFLSSFFLPIQQQQQMRIVVEDVHGNFSVNKAKTDLLWANMPTLLDNLKMWVRAKWHEKWKYHMLFMSNKSALTKAIENHYQTVTNQIEDDTYLDGTEFKPLTDSDQLCKFASL